MINFLEEYDSPSEPKDGEIVEANGKNGPNEPKDGEIVEAKGKNGPGEPKDGEINSGSKREKWPQ